MSSLVVILDMLKCERRTKATDLSVNETTTLQDYLQICQFWVDNISKKSENQIELQSLGYIHVNLVSAMHKNKK